MGGPLLPAGADKASRTMARRALAYQKLKEKQKLQQKEKNVDADPVPQLETEATQCHRIRQRCVVVVLVVLLVCCSADGFATFPTLFATLVALHLRSDRSIAAFLCCQPVCNPFSTAVFPSVFCHLLTIAQSHLICSDVSLPI